MKIIGTWVLIIIGVIFWVWFINQIAFHIQDKKTFTRKNLGLGLLLVGVLAVYSNLLGYLGLDTKLLYFYNTLSPASIGIFLLYLFLTFCLLLLIQKLRSVKKIWMQFLVGFFGLFSLVTAWIYFWWGVGFLWVIILVYAEELLKFTVGHSQSFKNIGTKYSKLLLCSLSIAFAFSIIENLFAFWGQLLSETGNAIQILSLRGLSSSVIHIVATWAIALCVIKLGKKQASITKFLIALSVGILIHLSYNLSIKYQITWIGILILPLAYFLLSYLLYHLDELYQQK